MQSMVYRYKAPEDVANPTIPALGVKFEYQSQRHEYPPGQEPGYPTFDNVLVAVIFPMGNPKSDVVHEIERTLPDGTVRAHPVYSRKYAELVKLFKSGNEVEGGGTPLSELGGLSAAIIDTMKARGIHSIEALNEAAEVAVDDMMGFRKYKTMANAYIENRKGNAPMVKMAEELAQRDAQIASLQRQLEDLANAVNKRGPGRPPKQQEAA